MECLLGELIICLIVSFLNIDLDVDPFDMSTLLIRKSTLFCSLGRQDESVKCGEFSVIMMINT